MNGWRGPSSAKFGDPPYRDRPSSAASIRTVLSLFDIPPAPTGITHFGSVAGSAARPDDAHEKEKLLRFFALPNEENDNVLD